MPLQSLPNETLSKPASGQFSFSPVLAIMALNITEVRESDEGQDVLDNKALKDFTLLRSRLKGSKHPCAYRKGVLIFLLYRPFPAMSALPFYNAHNHSVIRTLLEEQFYTPLTLTSSCNYFKEPRHSE